MPLLDINEERVARKFSDPRTLIGISDGGAHVDMLCNAGYPSYLLGTFVREKQALSLERAVQRMTSEPAQFFGLTDRGTLRPGLAADITTFDLDTVGSPERPEIRRDLPGGGRRLVTQAEGILYTIVNGQVLYEGRRHTGALPGHVLRAGQPPEETVFPRHCDERFDPLWRVCAEVGLPLSLHKPLVSGMPLTPAMPTMADLQIHVIHVVEQCLTRMVYGGVFERFPPLQVVSAENDVGWMPNWVHRLDHVHAKIANARQLPLKPSEYVRRNVWATFQDDPLGPATRQFFGEHNYMWASDFPHANSTFPNSLQVIDENFAGVPPEVRHNIVFENARRLYRI